MSTNRFFRALGLLLVMGMSGGAAVMAQRVELNVKVKPGSPSEIVLRNNAGEPTARTRMQLVGVRHLDRQVAVRRLAPKKNYTNASLRHLYTLEFPDGSVQSRIDALMTSGDFEWVEENRSRPLHAAPPLPADTATDPRVQDQWYHSYIRTFEAWDSTRGENSVLIGVLDTGLDYDHPEFEGQVAINAAEDANGNGTFEPWPDTVMVNGISGDFDRTDDDGNGFRDDVIGYDFTDQPRSPFGGDYLFEDADPMDDNNHGTLVAGIIAAKADNNIGGAGIAPDCRIKVLRAFAANGAGEDDDIARAIIYAADNGIQILNCSFGDIYPSQMMHAAVQYAEARGVVIVASAGNGTGDELHFPSNFDEVISVSASALNFDETSETLWPLSSFGLTVSLCAPGSGIFAPIVQDTANEENYGFFSGTSTSAPMVSAAVGLLFAQRGRCSPQQVRGLLTASADDISDEGWDHYTGAGRLNILKALQLPGASNVQILSPSNDSGTDGDSVWVVVNAVDPQFSALHLEYEAGTEGFGNWQVIANALQEQVLGDTIALWNVGGLAEGDYTLRLRLDKTDGSTAEDRIRFVIDRTAPQIDLRVAAPCWDNYERKMFFVFRAEDRSETRIHYRPLGGSDWEEQVFDRVTRHGHFLLGMEALTVGSWEYFLSATNEAGLVGQTALDTFNFAPEFVNLSGFDTLTYSIPMGHYLPGSYDLDGDNLDEVVMSEYSANLGFGKLKIWEYNAVGFVATDSLDFKPVLIPKDIQDADGDGLQELLVSVNDSIFIVEQPAANQYPQNIIWSDADEGFFAARFANTDGDAELELLAKDFVDYKVLENDGNGGYTVSATLEDVSPDYIGSVAPRVLVHDFDGDGLQETVFGDFDGDFLVYENDGANGYNNTWIDSTLLSKSGSYLVMGDFDGDAKQEIFVAAHTSLNRNEEDFEYEPGYWRLRIFEATGNDAFVATWEDFLFDIDTDGFNAATGGNIDQDVADELIFTTFPRTFIIEHDGSDYGMSWFHYGGLATHHVIGDFNGNGVNEFALGRGDKALFWEKDFNYTGPQPVVFLDGQVDSDTETRLYWQGSPNATEYIVWRGEITGPGSVLIGIIDSTAALTYQDAGLTPDTDYLYVLEAKNPGLSPVYSAFSNAVVLRPHASGTVDSVVAVSERQAAVWFSEPVRAVPEDKSKFVLNGSQRPSAIISSGDESQRVVLSFAEPFQVGSNQLRVDSTLRDRDGARFQTASLLQNFNFSPDTSKFAFFTRWEIRSSTEALIDFNVPMTDSVLDVGLWRLLPFGKVTNVRFDNSSQVTVVVQIEGAALGALGYPVSVILEGGVAQNGSPMADKEGNVATFSDNKLDLSEVYVYPNPYRRHELYPGIRFANLTRNATVHIYDAAGQKVITLQESDGDGGLEWNLVDAWGKRVRPGVYLYRVEAPDVEEVLGKFSILE